MNKLLSVLFLSICFPVILLAQSKTIKGKVVDETGQPASSVTVITKGSKKGTSTDKDGNFSIAVKGAGTVDLIFSSTEYATKIVTADGTEELKVQLTRSVTTSEDVVVIGYQTIKRKDLTGSVSSVGAAQLSKTPVNNAAEALTGRLAGLQVTSSEGSPDADVKLKIRGGGSITQDNSPLYIIDGIQVENGLNNISPQDIESIDLLKDAAATAIYGARGANGVIIITTKGGKDGRTNVSYNNVFGFKRLASKLDVLNPYEFVMQQYNISRDPKLSKGLVNGAIVDSIEVKQFDKKYGAFNTLGRFKDSANVDWQDEAMGRTAFMQTHNVGVNGGTKATQFNMSYTYNAEQGLLLNSDFTRHIVSLKIDHRASQKLKVGVSSRYNDQVVAGQGTSSEGSTSLNKLRQIIKYRPFVGAGIGVFDDEVSDDPENLVGNQLSLVNPIALINAEYRKKYQKTFNAAGYAQYNILKTLMFKTSIGIENQFITDNTFNDSITSASRQLDRKPLIEMTESKRFTVSNSNVLTWTVNNYKNKHDFLLLVGEETYQLDYNAKGERYLHFANGTTPTQAFAQLKNGQMDFPAYPTNSIYHSTLLSYFGKANYTYKDKYLLSLSYRTDKSSKFASGRQTGYFPAGSFAWRVSKEKFMSKVNWVSDLKFRVGYGAAGNNRIPDYLTLQNFDPQAPNVSYFLNGVPTVGAAPVFLSNKLLKWETTTSTNLGVDASFFKGKVQATVDIYKNVTKDLLINANIPGNSGYTSQLQNVGQTSNKGVELQLTATAIRSKDFTWTLNFNNSWNTNNVDKLTYGTDTIFWNSGYYTQNKEDFIVTVGHPVGLMYGYVTEGFYSVDDFTYDAATQKYTLKDKSQGVVDNTVLGVTSNPVQPGTVKFKDVNGDSIITTADKTIIGNANPKFSGGLNQQFTYKNFDLNIFVNWVVGCDVLNANKLEFTNGYTPDANALSVANGRWTNVNSAGEVVTDPVALKALNTNATLWKPINGDQGWLPTSWAVEDGSFLRINNISIGYNFPKKVLDRFKINKLRFYGTVNNVAVITGYSGYDPEVNTRRKSPLSPNVDYSAYPRSRSFVVGLNLNL